LLPVAAGRTGIAGSMVGAGEAVMGACLLLLVADLAG
jgi:hypothetical protein